MPVKACTWQELMENLQHRDTENADKNVGNEIMLGHRDTKNADRLLGHRDIKNADNLGHRDTETVDMCGDRHKNPGHRLEAFFNVEHPK